MVMVKLSNLFNIASHTLWFVSSSVCYSGIHDGKLFTDLVGLRCKDT